MERPAAALVIGWGLIMGFAGLITALCAQAATALPVAAAPDPEREVVVAGSRTATETASTDRIDRAEIKRLQPVDLVSVLARVPGVYAAQTGGAGGDTFLSVRGGEPNFTSVEIEGIRVNDPTNSSGGSFDLAQLPPAVVDALVVSRAPLSAVHGADTLSGVVQLHLVTPQADRTSAELNGRVDTARARGADGAVRLGWGGGGLLLGGEASDSGRLTPGSTISRRSFLPFAVQDAGDWRLRGFGLHAGTDRTRFPEDSGGPRLAASRALEKRSTRLDIAGFSVIRDTPAFAPHLALSWSDQGARGDTPAIRRGVLSGVPALTSDSRFRRAQVEGGVVARPLAVLTIAGGADYVDELGKGKGTIDFGFPLPTAFKLRRHDFALYGEASYRPVALLELTGAVRRDKSSSGPAVTTVRTSATLRPAEGLSVSASYADAFKLPSIYALAFPLIANPGLRPERGKGVEASASLRNRTGRLTLNVFRTVYRDLIDFDAALFTSVNRSRVTTKGAEIVGGITAGPVSVSGSVTFVDVDSAVPLRSRPRWQGAGSVDWQLGPAGALFAAGRFNAGFYDSSIPTGLIVTSGHAELDLGGHRQVAPGIRVELVVRNATAARYEEAVGFPAPGRLVRLAIRLDI